MHGTVAGKGGAGPSFLVPTPPEITVEFERDGSGAVSALRWQEAGGPVRRAPRIARRREDVRFTNGGVTLAGTLTLPLSAGSHLAVILVHGPGAQPRDHAVLGWIADYFTLNGVAVLAYDKRGVGGSTGNWNDATLDDLAGDVLAAAAPGISPIAICHSSNNGLPGGTELQRATWVASAPGDFRGPLCRPKAVVPRSGNPCPIPLSYGATSAPSRRSAGGAIGSPCGTFLLRPQKCSQQRPNLPKTKLSRAGFSSAATTS